MQFNKQTGQVIAGAFDVLVTYYTGNQVTFEGDTAGGLTAELAQTTVLANTAATFDPAKIVRVAEVTPTGAVIPSYDGNATGDGPSQ
jgi:hypothetical protein